MNKIIDGYKNYKGQEYENIRDVHFDKKEDLMDNLGRFCGETEKDGLFVSDGLRLSEGIYLYQTYYDPKKALRIYKDFADYKYVLYRDDMLVSELQKRQDKIKLTEFPTGVVTIENFVIGQEIPYYENYKTLADLVINKKIDDLPLNYYMQMVNILKELSDNGIFYSDVHAKNFMINQEEENTKLIDFEQRFLSFDEDKRNLYRMQLLNLKKMITRVNEFYNYEFNKSFDKINRLEEMQEYIHEETQKKLK